jgi:hypothetical protein
METFADHGCSPNNMEAAQELIADAILEIKRLRGHSQCSRAAPETELVNRVAEAINDAVAQWQPGSPQRIKEMAARAAIKTVRLAQNSADTEELDPIEKIEPFEIEITGPYHSSLRLATPDRIVASVYVVDGDQERAFAEAGMIKEAFRLGGKEIDRLHYASGVAQTQAEIDSDIGILLSVLHNFEDAVCETIDDTEGVVAQIERDHKARAALSVSSADHLTESCGGGESRTAPIGPQASAQRRSKELIGEAGVAPSPQDILSVSSHPPTIDDVPSCGQENDYRRTQSPIMETAAKAAEIVEGWSDAKQEYAERVTARRRKGK